MSMTDEEGARRATRSTHIARATLSGGSKRESSRGEDEGVTHVDDRGAY